MYRLSAFLIAVAVLVGLVFSGGFMPAEKPEANKPDSVATIIEHSEVELQTKADQELTDIDSKAAQNGSVLALPEIKKPLTTEDISTAVQKAGADAHQTALSVGQSAEQAQNAKQDAEVFVRARMERQMREEQQALKTI